ncbi:MAG TPA: MBL fold metallo-hydrolase [Gemmatirosa sp.]
MTAAVRAGGVAFAVWGAGVLAAQPATAQPATGAAGSGGADSALRITQLDVGQGDAALVTTPEGRRVLIDGGTSATAVAALLAGAGIDTLDLVIASHNHADHIGGLPRVFTTCVVRAYIENGLPQPTAIYARLVGAVERMPNIRVLAATARTVTIGSVTLRILPPSGVNTTQNDNSVGVLVGYGAFRALFTGDSERRELAHWLAHGEVPRVTLVKAAHHGASNGTTAAWVRATHPAVTIISVGAENRYGHPSAAVERMWAAVPSEVYRTDRDGAIEVRATADGRYAVRTHAALAAAVAPAAH